MCVLSISRVDFVFFFFFQAEDGIRDGRVTGVQTCALPIYDTEREDKLSNRLRWLVRRDEAFRQSGMVVDREVPVFDDNSSEEPIGRIDFRFLSAQRHTDADWHFVIEAKRLHVTFKKAGWQSLVSEYVTGHQGMMCFIDRRYARDLTESAMLGYVF